MSRHYVYAISVDGVVRYVGKGCGKRMEDHDRYVRKGSIKTRFHRLLAEAIEAGSTVEAARVAENLSEYDALALEAKMIAAHRDQLWNTMQTGHRTGSRVGWQGRPESSEKKRAKMKAHYADPEWVAELNAARHRGKRKQPLSPEAKARVSAATAESNRRRAGGKLQLSDEARVEKRDLALSNPGFRKNMGRLTRYWAARDD